MRGRRVFRGRLVADGMWAAHLTWGAWTLSCLVPGAWFCRLAATASDRSHDFVGPLFVGVLPAATGVVLLLVWRIATGWFTTGKHTANGAGSPHTCPPGC